MALSRQLLPLVNALEQENDWQPVMGRDMRGQTLGILGLGRLGGQLAGFAQAMGMRVIAWSENLDEAHCESLNVEHVSRDSLFEQADAVSIHLRHSSRTHAMVNADDLQKLGARGYLINTSRAQIVDLDALKHALDANTIAGAAIDVYEKEPTPANHWLVQHPRVLATPHIGYCTEETFHVFYEQMLEAFKAFYTGAAIRVIGA
jgi:phosphoglycerate dehydrogenase-like enzyme